MGSEKHACRLWQVKRVVIIGTSVIFFGTTLTMKTKLGACT